jgi:hypothetical protein
LAMYSEKLPRLGNLLPRIEGTSTIDRRNFAEFPVG